jgi:hypothetical protein
LIILPSTNLTDGLVWQNHPKNAYLKLFSALCISLNVTGLPLHRTTDQFLPLFFKAVNSVEEVSPCHLPDPVFDGLLTSQSCVTSSYTFKIKHFQFIAMSRVEHFLA